MSTHKRVALYLRVSTADQHPETQLHDLRTLAAQRGFEIVAHYTDKMSGAKAKRPGLDQMMADARRGKFNLVLVWAFIGIAIRYAGEPAVAAPAWAAAGVAMAAAVFIISCMPIPVPTAGTCSPGQSR